MEIAAAQALAFLGRHWREFALAGLFAILASYAGCEHAGRMAEHQGRARDAAAAAQTLARARADVAQCHQTVETLNGSLAHQNAAVDAEHQVRVTAEARERASEQRASSALAAVRHPAVLDGHPGPDVCRSALDVARSAP